MLKKGFHKPRFSSTYAVVLFVINVLRIDLLSQVQRIIFSVKT